jgi:hypothetical protein
MAAYLYMPTLLLILGTVLIVFGMKYVSEALQARARPTSAHFDCLPKTLTQSNHNTLHCSHRSSHQFQTSAHGLAKWREF